MGFLTIILIIILTIVLKSAHSTWVTSFKFWEKPVLKYQVRSVVASIAHPLQSKCRTSIRLITNPTVVFTLHTSKHSAATSDPSWGQSLANSLQGVFGSFHCFGGCISLYSPFFGQKLLHWNSTFFTAAWVFFQHLDNPGSVSNPLGEKTPKKRKKYLPEMNVVAAYCTRSTSVPV